MQLQHMTRPLEIKSLQAEEGTFEGYGSVFGVRDHYDDVVDKMSAFSWQSLPNFHSTEGLAQKAASRSSQGLVSKIPAAEGRRLRAFPCL